MPARTPRSSSAPSLQPLAGQVRDWTGTLFRWAGHATDLGLSVAAAKSKSPRQKAAITQAGRLLRSGRESLGMTVSEVAEAIGLGDSQVIEKAESGMLALPFEVILRLAAVLGRHDPIAFIMDLTRRYQPELWQQLDALGIGRLAVQGSRERELANVYRASDSARQLSDEQFKQVLAFTRQAFESAVALTQSLSSPSQNTVGPSSKASQTKGSKRAAHSSEGSKTPGAAR